MAKRPQRLNPSDQSWPGLFVPDWLMERPDLHAGDKILYAYLCQEAGASRTCDPAHESIAQAIGASVRVVRQILARLERQGWLRITERSGLANRYDILAVPPRFIVKEVR